ncbi:MAG: site-specific integrase [Raineya sp.]|nr:site-specific integrase [Raineya sp.]
MKRVGLTFILDKRRPLKDNTFPVKLQVIYNRRSRVYSTGFSCNEIDFEKVLAPRPRDEYKMLKMQLIEIEQKALEVIKGLKDNFTFEAFKERMYSKNASGGKSLKEYFEMYIAMLKAEGRIRTAQTYQNAWNSLTKFKKNISFGDLTPMFLKRYELHELQKGNSPTSISFYLRNLRAIVNLAIQEGNFDASKYPFGKRGYTIPKSKNIKKALSQSEIKALIEYEPQNKHEAFAKDFFLFSFYCNGINFKDIALLKWENIEGNKVSFIRAKTAKTSTQGKVITFFLNNKSLEILNKYAQMDNPKGYVFRFFEDTLTAKQQIQRLVQIINNINKHLKQIATKLGFNKKLTTYVARHTFATLLKRNGLPTELISEALGHHSVQTTEAYLDSFGKEIWEDIAKKLEQITKATPENS